MILTPILHSRLTLDPGLQNVACTIWWSQILCNPCVCPISCGHAVSGFYRFVFQYKTLKSWKRKVFLCVYFVCLFAYTHHARDFNPACILQFNWFCTKLGHEYVCTCNKNKIFGNFLFSFLVCLELIDNDPQNFEFSLYVNQNVKVDQVLGITSPA